MIRNTFAARLFLCVLLGIGFEISSAAGAGTAEPLPVVALVSASPGFLEWVPLVESEGMTLALAGPRGVIHTYQFLPGQAPALSLFGPEGVPLPDGTYTWELRVTPPKGAGLELPLVQSGYFTIAAGRFVAPDLVEPPEGRQRRGSSKDLGVTTAPDQVVPDDLIVDGKGCIGLGCANNEAFGGEALRLKQSVVRLRFEDTSAAAGFPTGDWQITVNDSASGGANRFSVEDLTAGTTPLTVRGGAPNNTLYLDGVGNVGLGTATPAVRLDVKSASSGQAVTRLQNTSATGFSGIEFLDQLGNVDLFFGIDNNASTTRLNSINNNPIAILTNSAERLRITSTGDVGIGTASPAEFLHAFENVDANTILAVENPNTGLSAAGVLRSKSDSAIVNFQAHGSGRTLSRFGEPLASWAEFLQVTGNGLIIGTFNAKPLILGTGSANRLHITGTGEVGIGTTTPSSKLHVNGGDIRVSGGSFIDDGTTLNVPDYVFEPDYKLTPLAELKTYIAQEKHLPNVPSAQEIKERGLNLGQFQTRLLEKIEELTLYTIDQQEQIKAQQELIGQLEERLARLEEKN